MGNSGSNSVNGRQGSSSRRSHPPPLQTPQPEITSNSYFLAAATPFTNAPGYYQYPGSYPLPPRPATPVPIPMAYVHLRGPAQANWFNGRYPCGHVMQPPAPHVEHQKAVTIRNDVNLKKKTLRVEPDEPNPGKYLVAFTFDATIAGSINIVFFAKEGDDGRLSPTKESLLPTVRVHFQKGLGQEFRQPSGTGIDFSMFEEVELSNKGDLDVYPLVVKAEASPDDKNENPHGGPKNVQITQATFVMEKGEYQVSAVKQALWMNDVRYELQEIYGIGNSVQGDFDGNDIGKECVVCLSEPREIAVLPCRHMCMCSECAKVLRFQTNRCPICRQPIERLLEIKVSNGAD